MKPINLKWPLAQRSGIRMLALKKNPPSSLSPMDSLGKKVLLRRTRVIFLLAITIHNQH